MMRKHKCHRMPTRFLAGNPDVDIDAVWATDPEWDRNNDAGPCRLKVMRQAILEGLNKAGDKTGHWPKVSTVAQEPDEHPSDSKYVVI